MTYPTRYLPHCQLTPKLGMLEVTDWLQFSSRKVIVSLGAMHRKKNTEVDCDREIREPNGLCDRGAHGESEIKVYW